MAHNRLFLSLLVLALLLSIPSIVRIPRVLPLLRSNVRAAAPEALEELRSKGLWLVNTDLINVEWRDHAICFLWEHRYTSREGKDPAEILPTCIDVPEE